MVKHLVPLTCLLAGLGFAGQVAGTDTEPTDFSPPPEEQQLPQKMHSAMEVQPHIKVGLTDADLLGRDNRALQAAVDYVAGLGGGVVEIGPGEYLMRDALHLRSFVSVRGTPGQTVLRKSAGASSALALDGDFGEEQITLRNPSGFEIGDGVAMLASNVNYFAITVARITGRKGNTFSLDRPLNEDCLIRHGALAATSFPVISGIQVEGVRLEHLIVEGRKEQNLLLDGCRSGGIFLYRGHRTVIEQCTVRNYNGDGISFQQCNDVTLTGCVSEDNAAIGFHAGSGSQRPVMRECAARNNGEDGLFFCWRVRHGVFENNLLEANGRFGVSLGHKDTDNVLRHNVVRNNRYEGVRFRNETLGMAPHRNRLEDNVIENNGTNGTGFGIRVLGETRDLILKNNSIRDTRPQGSQCQTVGIQVDEKVGTLTIEGNSITATTPLEDRRKPVAR